MSQSILDQISKHGETIRTRFGVTKIGIFGSFARGEETETSDVDVLVEFDTPSFDAYMDLKFFLEDLFQRNVDLVTASSLKSRLRDRILQEVRYAA